MSCPVMEEKSRDLESQAEPKNEVWTTKITGPIPKKGMATMEPIDVC